MDQHRWRTWRAAMGDALYGEAGFYTASGAPGRHFSTAAHTSPQWAAAIGRLAARVETAIDSADRFMVVDVGAGGGELLTGLAAIAPQHWELHGVDLAPAPLGLDPRITWSREAGEHITGLLIANELLDVVPVDVVERHEGWARQVEVTPTGEEEIGSMVTGRDAQWLSQWWPLGEDGDRAEVGWPRDELWQSLTARLHSGLAVAIDYAVDPDHDVAGTITGYRNGRQVEPVPDGSCDITAHVLFDSLMTGGDVLVKQRAALQQLGVGGARPSYDGDSASYLADLSATGDTAELMDPDGLGDFTWLIHPKGMPSPIIDPDSE